MNVSTTFFLALTILGFVYSNLFFDILIIQGSCLYFSPLLNLSFRGHGKIRLQTNYFPVRLRFILRSGKNCRYTFLYTFSSTILLISLSISRHKKISAKVDKICTRKWVRVTKKNCKDKYYLSPSPNQPTPPCMSVKLIS